MSFYSSMAEPSSIDVLIIGAGPTGLMLGCQLSLYPNISFRIIDKNSSGTTESRALVVQARSLELFAQLGLIEKVIHEGEFVDKMKLFFQGQCKLQIDFTHIRAEQQPLLTRYPYLLLLEQSNTEKMLETFLNEHNVKVERNTEAIDLIDLDSSNSIGAQVTLSNGEIIRTKYVCACDGARSTVRHKLNLPFGGETYSESLFVADCQINNSPLGKNEFAIFCESTGMAGIFPISNNQYRLIGTVHQEEKDVHINFNDVVTMLKTRTRHFNMNISNCIRLSIYRSHHRHVTTFRYRKRYFLLGDAAHIHSPVGGQGMNTGLQDAHNLGWKLAYVLTYSANDRLLDTYHDERSIVAKTLVKSTDRMFTFISNPHWFARFVRLYITPYLLRFFIQPILNSSHNIRQAFFHRFSQLGITYRSSNVYDYGASAGNFHQNTPLPGDRFPYVIFDPCYYHLVIFENQQSAKLNLFIELIKRQYSKIIKIHDIHEENFPFRFEGAILIRPDGYIAYRTTVFDIHHFECYLGQFFIKQ
jgi:2-polyprenyl-6-methoxyphenol hydroxylase-like FAD-dependent oxidoreductase